MAKVNLGIGILLTILGIILLLFNLGVNPIGLQLLWPIFPILIGALFGVVALGERRIPLFIVPAIILILSGFAFLYCSLTTWENMIYLWPVFVLSPGVGFLWLYFTGDKQRNNLLWGSIMIVLSLIFFIFPSQLEVLWPLIVTIVGLIFIFFYLVGKPSESK